MTYQQVVPEVIRLPLNEKLLLLETLSRAIRDEVMASSVKRSSSSLQRALGMLKPDGPVPTDEELKEDYLDYLIKKYS